MGGGDVAGRGWKCIRQGKLSLRPEGLVVHGYPDLRHLTGPGARLRSGRAVLEEAVQDARREPDPGYKFGTDTKGLKVEKDDSIGAYLQHAKPDGDNANWLPTPAGEFDVILRLHPPREAVLTGKYQLPEIVRVK